MDKLGEIALESEAGFRALFEYATIGIVVINHKGEIELINPSAKKLFGYQASELIGQTIEVLIPESFRRRHIHHREEYNSSPKARPMGLGIDLYALKKDGTIFPVEISLGHYQLGDEHKAMAFITDISKRKSAETELKKINEELEERIKERTLELTEALSREKELNEMKSKFVSMASHEFRTPLSAILSSVSLVERYIESGQEEKRRKHVERIKSSVKNLTEILNDFLSLEKLERGIVEIERQNIELGQFMEDIIEEVSGMLKPGQSVAFNQTGQDEVVTDRKILRNILLNLLSNAIKYSPEEKEIQIYAEAFDTSFTLKVTDKGMGIPEEEQKNIFGKFFRANNSVNIQGTGLGLNIVKRYVEILNGSIGFSSRLNEGTTFIVEFKQKHS
jgi:PAS domain S-box-containing protein